MHVKQLKHISMENNRCLTSPVAVTLHKRAQPKLRKNFIGRQFGSVKVISSAGTNGMCSLWNCACACGNKVVLSSARFRPSKPCKFCSPRCSLNISHRRARTTHGMSRHPAYHVWTGLKSRCSNPHYHGFHNYGGRGISVCRRWRRSFITFWQDMGATYKKGLDIDREDNDGNYSVKNCRWATRSENILNTRRAHGFSPKILSLAAVNGVSVDSLRRRVRQGIPMDIAASYPPRKMKTTRRK